MEREKLIREILEFLNEREVRCTYGAVAGLLGIAPIAVGGYLGERRPEASWVVRKDSGKPTGYSKNEQHPQLFAKKRIISDPQELRQEIEAFLRSRCGEADRGAICDAAVDEIDDTVGDAVDGAENGANKTTADGWICWLPFPDPNKGGYLCAPFGPGVYELRNRETGELVLFGRGNNVAFRMTSLLPIPLGAGHRDNDCKRQYCHDHLANIEYRTKACLSEDQAKCEERALRNRNKYMFPT